MAPHSSTLAWKIPWMDEPGRLQSMGLLRVGLLEIELPYDPAIPLLGIHTKETRSERDTCTPVHPSAAVHCSTVYHSQDMEAT